MVQFYALFGRWSVALLGGCSLALALLAAPVQAQTLAPVATGSWTQLEAEALRIGKPAWRPMLNYVAALHQRATHPAAPPFAYEWEDLGPGYVYNNAFGHWDVVHETIDVLPAYPEHALHQLLNDLKTRSLRGCCRAPFTCRAGWPGTIRCSGTTPLRATHRCGPWPYRTTCA